MNAVLSSPPGAGFSGEDAMPADDSMLETRVAKLQSDVAHIQSDVSDIKADLRELKVETRELRNEIDRVRTDLTARIDGKIDALRAELTSTKIWALGLYGSLLYILARGFKWL
jgi:chromosome segregation ATPase